MRSRHRLSQSLLEATLAIGVILVSTTAAGTLIVSTVAVGQSSTDKIAAANFAREGVEIVRGIRDSNWLKRAQNIPDGPAAAAPAVQWDDTGKTTDGYVGLGTDAGGSPATKNYVAVLTVTQDDPTCVHPAVRSDWTLAECLPANGCNPNSPADTNLAMGAFHDRCANTDASYFTQACVGSCQPSKYSRLISITKVSEATPGWPPLEYLEVTSKVTWSNHGTKMYVASERFYDWR